MQVELGLEVRDSLSAVEHVQIIRIRRVLLGGGTRSKTYFSVTPSDLAQAPEWRNVSQVI